MDKILSCGNKAKVGDKVKIIAFSEGFKLNSITTITATEGIVLNKSNHPINLNRWKHIIQCEGWLVNINNVKAFIN